VSKAGFWKFHHQPEGIFSAFASSAQGTLEINLRRNSSQNNHVGHLSRSVESVTPLNKTIQTVAIFPFSIL